MENYSFVGVDVAKDKFDVALLLGTQYRCKIFDNSQKGFKAFIDWLKRYTDNAWVCMEATGHYSELLADYLYQHTIRVSVVNPLQIKHFGKANLTRNKNDILDSKVIAHFCKTLKPRLFKSRGSSQKALRELVQLLDTLKEQSVQLQNQRHSIQSTLVKNELDSVIMRLKKRIEKLEKKIVALTRQDESLETSLALLISIVGIGTLSAVRILAYMPDISLFNNAKQLAAFIGVSPRQNESGRFKGKTCLSKYGNSRFRKTFYMPAMSAKRFNQSLKPFVERLEAKGLKPKAIIGAIMRKLVHIVFGILKSRRPFDASLVTG